LFAAGNTKGIFQFEQAGAIRLLRRVQPNCFEEIVATTSLNRPGASDYIDNFVKRKHGRERVEMIDPSLEDILGPTYGIMLYQEQVMQVAQRFGGFSLGKADILRRAMGKKNAVEMHKMEEERPVYYSGIGKSNDEYNRRGKYNYKKIGVDSLGNDIFMSRISTLHGDSVVLDTIYGGFTRQYESDNDDFAYSRRMSRFDGFWGGYYDPWFAGRSSFYVGWGWRSPYYGGWYDRWDDPWSYGYYGGYPYYGYGRSG